MFPDSQVFRLVISLGTTLLPWFLRRSLLQFFLGYELHPTSRIGIALVIPKKLRMQAGSKIKALTVCKSLEKLEIGENSSIGRQNLITGHLPSKAKSSSFQEEHDRKSSLTLGKHTAITNRHFIDCTNKVSIGDYSIVAGYSSQILTHSVDFERSIQKSNAVEIGDYCFVGTDSTLLPGSKLPNFSILGAKGLLSKKYSKSYCLYAGVPARTVKELSKDLKYFNRKVGYVV